MPTPADVRESLPARITALGISRADFCRIVGWSGTKLSRFLSGDDGMGFPEITGIHLAVDELQRISDLLKPVRINFSDAQSVNALLNLYRRGELSTVANGLEDETRITRGITLILALKANEGEPLWD
jgi:hypothetical protein